MDMRAIDYGVLVGPIGSTVDLTPAIEPLRISIEIMEDRLSRLESIINMKPVSTLSQITEQPKAEVDNTKSEQLYQHYKGNIYELLMIAHNSEAPTERLVIYRDVNKPDKPWARPYEMFFEKVYHNGEYVDRFKKL